MFDHVRHHDSVYYLWPRHSTDAPSPATTPMTTTPSSAPQSPGFLPSGSALNSVSAASVSSGLGGANVFTTSIPVTTITQPSTTFTSFTISTVTRSPSSSLVSIPSSSSTASAAFSTSSTIQSLDVPICPGAGIDGAAAGILAAIIVPSVIGLIIWLIFAIVRPKFRQIYALREWFVQPDLRPKPLGSSLFAFISPNVPMVPDMPDDVSNAGRTIAQDAELFPSDEQLSQRTLWLALMIALGWSVLALGGALPLYLVNTPCNAQLPSDATYGGGYSTLTDLSLLKLLRLFEAGDISTQNLSTLQRRDVAGDLYHARIRIIVLTVLVLVLGLIPALIKILREFTGMVAFRKRWLQVKCEGKDLAWLSVRKAPGFQNWGEKQLKDYLVKIGLSSNLGEPSSRDGNSSGVRPRNGHRGTRRRDEELPLNQREDDRSEIDVESLFSIGNTHRVALLIDERDEILENLEIAETKYISSFRVSTPEPSVADLPPISPPADPNRPYISRPLPLLPQNRRQRSRNHLNRAYASSSLAPTSFVAPSSYYKLRGLRAVNGGHFADPGFDKHQSLTESIASRIVGSRFMEVNRNSAAYGRLPLGSHVAVEKNGELGPAMQDSDSWLPPIPDPRLHGPNYAFTTYDDMPVDEMGVVQPIEEQDEWVDVSSTREDLQSDFNGLPPDHPGPTSFMRRPRRQGDTPPSTRRSTFPLRNDFPDPDFLPPPHMRLQPAQPFVRPLDGLQFDDLGDVYTEITQWRSRLKMINAEINERQKDCYNDIANGTGIYGWILVGRGLRHIPGMEIIEGRAKEDIRWDVLQNERNWLDTSAMWALVLTVVVALAATLTAAAGLALAPAPDVAQYLPFLKPLLTAEPIAAGVATVLAPAVAATLFIVIGLGVIHWVGTIHGSTSVSANQLMIFKITFFVLTAVGTLWLVAIGALLFSMQAINDNSGATKSLGNGSIYMSILALAMILNVAIIFPGLLLLQPWRLWAVRQGERQAITPRQRFRAVYPRTYNPSFAIGACVLAIVFASTFALIFPLIAPAVVILLLLTLIAHRFLVGYVYARTHSQTGGLLQLWLLRRFATLLSFQPILLGLIYLSRHFWIEGGILIGAGVFVIIFVEIYTNAKMRLPGRGSLSPITRDSLDRFQTSARRDTITESDASSSSVFGPRIRGSMTSVLEMMSITLAVMPGSSTHKGAVPLSTDNLDDLTATERAARTHPDAPPHLPPLPFADHAEEMAGILYAPELIAPPPIIWLPNDSAGVARSEAIDLQKYHNLQVTLDVHAKQDVMPRRSSETSRRRAGASSR